MIVTATGLNLLAFGGLELEVDGEPVAFNERLAYKSMMLSGVPNFVFAVGYTNSSWTLKIDLVCEHLCRMLALMDARGDDTVVPVDEMKRSSAGRSSTSVPVTCSARSLCSRSRDRTARGRLR